MRNGIDAVSAPLPTLFVSPPAVFTASLERLPHALGRPPPPSARRGHPAFPAAPGCRLAPPRPTDVPTPTAMPSQALHPRDPPVALVPIGTNRAAPGPLLRTCVESIP